MPFRFGKIEVRDPRNRRRYVDPYLQIYVNQDVQETGEPIFNYNKNVQHRIIPCGAFFAVEVRPNLGMTFGPWVDVSEHIQGDIGQVNTSKLIDHQLVGVRVDAPRDPGLQLFMGVNRVKRMLRQRNLGYELILDEYAGYKGLLKWRLESLAPTCYGGAHDSHRNQCNLEPVGNSVYFKGAHLNLCSKHRIEFERIFYRDKQARKAATR